MDYQGQSHRCQYGYLGIERSLTHQRHNKKRLLKDFHLLAIRDRCHSTVEYLILGRVEVYADYLPVYQSYPIIQFPVLNHRSQQSQIMNHLVPQYRTKHPPLPWWV